MERPRHTPNRLHFLPPAQSRPTRQIGLFWADAKLNRRYAFWQRRDVGFWNFHFKVISVNEINWSILGWYESSCEISTHAWKLKSILKQCKISTTKAVCFVKNVDVRFQASNKSQFGPPKFIFKKKICSRTMILFTKFRGNQRSDRTHKHF